MKVVAMRRRPLLFCVGITGLLMSIGCAAEPPIQQDQDIKVRAVIPVERIDAVRNSLAEQNNEEIKQILRKVRSDLAESKIDINNLTRPISTITVSALENIDINNLTRQISTIIVSAPEPKDQAIKLRIVIPAERIDAVRSNLAEQNIDINNFTKPISTITVSAPEPVFKFNLIGRTRMRMPAVPHLWAQAELASISLRASRIQTPIYGTFDVSVGVTKDYQLDMENRIDFAIIVDIPPDRINDLPE